MNEITKELLEALHDCERVMSAELKGLLVIQPELKKARAAIAKAEATLAAPQPANDGWIPWEGGERPVDTIVVVKLRSGGIGTDHACLYDWRHVGAPVDIVAYQVAQSTEETGS